MDGQDFNTQLHVVIDDGLQNRLLVEQLSGLGLNAHLLPTSSDLSSLQTLVEQQSRRMELRGLHLYTHGQPGALRIGQSLSTTSTLPLQALAWEAIGRQLCPGGDLLLYGCELARGSSGQNLIDTLADVTGLDIAASSDITGSGGDWDLEYRHGSVDPSLTDGLTGLNWDGRLSTTLTTPVKVPLHWRDVDASNDGARKLGIYAALGGSRQPQLFELDTGGAGFYPTYGDAAIAPWWGGNWRPTGNTFKTVYDSGLTYAGNIVKTDVELFARPTDRHPLFKAERVIVGQTSSITDAKDAKRNHWPPGKDNQPPVNDAFYGDFGLATKVSAKGINSLSQQLRYGPGLTAGFRVHASERKPWVQFGLTRRDLEPTTTMFRMDRTKPSATSSTGVPFYNFKVTRGTIAIHAGTGRNRREFTQENIGMILDTGAQTTIHQNSKGLVPADLTAKGDDKQIIDGAVIRAQGPSINRTTKGTLATILRTIAGSGPDSRVKIQDSGKTYLNTGIHPFLANDVVYNLADGQLILIPRTKSRE